ncbi:uncharacterized protein FOMMEDRAFT_162039 [Fomitiporia mediterranea MF3/22]|uniref:uncharacterized protein n=1 Tax=Fomitiporia mediterranea (strain MF3/22) TaxID=694068 RepID=UPI0004408B7B|nr:uncharacterized protein FOMMEDRAFT_162039 [Fomitiporia mediterranea MF3/22]EJC98274.1 hypothetical protein FOMMEDRAFT_162039 [Fomitiporia mediterranea MF3/22]
MQLKRIGEVDHALEVLLVSKRLEKLQTCAMRFSCDILQCLYHELNVSSDRVFASEQHLDLENIADLTTNFEDGNEGSQDETSQIPVPCHSLKRPHSYRIASYD